jgi:hypothetical protein
MKTTRSVREAASAMAALSCALDQTLTEIGAGLVLSPEEATEATADLSRLTDELAGLADLLVAGLDPLAAAPPGGA